MSATHERTAFTTTLNRPFSGSSSDDTRQKKKKARELSNARTWTAGIAAIVVIVVSAIAQALGYIVHINLPEIIALAPVTVAILLILPVLFSGEIFKGWMAFGSMFVLTLLIYGSMAAANGFSPDGFRLTAQIAVTISCAFIGYATGANGRWNKGLNRLLFWTTLAMFLMLGAIIVIFPPNDSSPKNIVGGAMMFLAVLIVAIRLDATNKPKSLMLLAPLLMFAGIVTGDRTVLGLGGVSFVLDKILPKVKLRLAHRLVILVACVVSVVSVMMYLYSDQIPGFSEANLYVQEKTGRQITSGRQLIWPIVMKQIDAHPWTGSGFSVTAAQFTGLNDSTHNAFLMILLQVGWTGLIPVVGMLLALGWTGTGSIYTPWRTLLAITLMIVITVNSFETVLIQNNFRISALIWLSLGYICARIPLRRYPVNAAIRSS